MGRDLADVRLIDLVPSSIRSDATIAAIAAAVEPELQAVNQAIPNVLLWPRIDELPEPIVDLLGWQMHADFWRSDLALDTKRRLVKSSIRWHRKKGTPWAVRTVLADMGYSDVELIEEFVVRNLWNAAGGHRLDGTWFLDGSVYLVPLSDVTDLPYMPNWAYFALRVNLSEAVRANFMDEVKAAVDMAKRAVCWPIWLYYLQVDFEADPDYSADGHLVIDTQMRPHFDDLLLDGTWNIGVDAHVVRLGSVHENASLTDNGENPAAIDITIYRSEHFSQAFVLEQPSGSPLDLTGATITAQIRQEAINTAALIADFSVSIPNPASGEFLLNLTGAQTSGIVPVRGYYDVLISDSSGLDTVYITGRVTFENTLCLDGSWRLGDIVPAVVHEYLYDRRLASSAGVVMRSVIPVPVTVED